MSDITPTDGNDMLYGGKRTPGGDGQRDLLAFKTHAEGGGGYDVIGDFEYGRDAQDLRKAGFTDVLDVLAHTEATAHGVLLDIPGGGMVHILTLSLPQFDESDVLV